MTILIAGDDAVNQTLAEHLAGDSRHQVFTVTEMAGLEEAEATLRELDVLLFSAAYSTGRGKELRDSMRERFPGLQSVLITGENGEPIPLETITGWLAVFESDGREAPGVSPGPVLLGDYELREKCRPTETTDTFRAVQRSMNREVILERLRPELLGDRAAVKQFRKLVRARAGVSCPWIAAVYEAQESAGTLYYTRELIRGRSLDELVAMKARLSPEECLQLLRASGEAMTWLADRNVAREPLRRHHLVQGQDGAPRLANIATASPVPLDEPEEIRTVAECLMRVADFQLSHARELSHVLGLMKAKGPHALTNWKGVLREARAALQRMTEARSSSHTEGRDRSGLKRRKRGGPLVAVLLALVAGGTALAWWASQQGKPRREPFKASLVKIPAGEFIFRDGQRLSLPDFWMDSHEVTIGHYARFLAATGGETRYDHPDQPKEKPGHEPPDWTALLDAAKSGGRWRGYPVSLDCPVFNVDWWDAFACAQWMGRRLPTEQEWEKAARGTNGRAWPWGMEPDPKRANTGADYSEPPGEGKGSVDGFAWWCEVNAMPEDVSAFHIYGMAGNVCEWTATRLPDTGDPDRLVPVFRGGDFHRTSTAAMTTSWLAKSASYAQPYLGFRTVSDSPPAAD
jgi:formylglycine-generating enzyme required for sulfatase activity